MKSIILKIFISVAVISITLNACKKDEINISPDNETETSTDNALAENTFDNALTIVDQAQSSDLSTFKNGGSNSENIILSACATIWRDTIATTREVIVDFGTVNCVGADGRSRRGKIILTYTGAYKATGSVKTISFDNYYVNDNKVEGNKTITNQGKNAQGDIVYSINVAGSITLANNFGIIVYNSTRQRIFIEGVNTIELIDDVYLITGTSSGSSRNGDLYNVTIKTPLRRELNCKNFVSGSIEYIAKNRRMRLLDFGNGVCDSLATVTINGIIYTIILK